MDTVAELIDKLQEFDGNMPVRIIVNGHARKFFDADVDADDDGEPVVLLELVWES